MEEEKKAILEAFRAMQQAMIDKDVDKMLSLVSDDKTFTHMSRRVQSKEEFFNEIKEGILNYYFYTIENPEITIDKDKVILTADTTLNAKVYGISGSWKLHTKTHFIKIEDKWIQCNE